MRVQSCAAAVENAPAAVAHSVATARQLRASSRAPSSSVGCQAHSLPPLLAECLLCSSQQWALPLAAVGVVRSVMSCFCSAAQQSLLLVQRRVTHTHCCQFLPEDNAAQQGSPSAQWHRPHPQPNGTGLTRGPMGCPSRSKLSTVSSRPNSSMSPSSLWGAAAASAWGPSGVCPVPLGSNRPFSRGAVRSLFRMYLVLQGQHSWPVKRQQDLLPSEVPAQYAAKQAACHACLLCGKPRTSLGDTMSVTGHICSQHAALPSRRASAYTRTDVQCISK